MLSKIDYRDVSMNTMQTSYNGTVSIAKWLSMLPHMRSMYAAKTESAQHTAQAQSVHVYTYRSAAILITCVVMQYT